MWQSSQLIDQRFYTVLTSSARYLYLDIDYKWDINDHCIRNTKIRLINIITRQLSQFISTYGIQFNMNVNNSNLIIWDATRSDKFSLHIIHNGYIMHVLDINNSLCYSRRG